MPIPLKRLSKEVIPRAQERAEGEIRNHGIKNRPHICSKAKMIGAMFRVFGRRASKVFWQRFWQKLAYCI
jgi:hypothetical protein